MQDNQFPPIQRRRVSSEPDGLSVEIKNVGVKPDFIHRAIPSFRIVCLRYKYHARPGHRHPVIRIVGAPHAGLGAVINGRSACPGHLHERHKTLNVSLSLVRLAHRIIGGVHGRRTGGALVEIKSLWS